MSALGILEVVLGYDMRYRGPLTGSNVVGGSPKVSQTNGEIIVKLGLLEIDCQRQDIIVDVRG